MLLTLETLNFRCYLIIFAILISESYLVLILICSSLVIIKAEGFSLLIGHLYFLSSKCMHISGAHGPLALSIFILRANTQLPSLLELRDPTEKRA